jgi:hypothetical protein
MGGAQTELDQCMQKREDFHASLICYHARLVKVKNVSVGVSERQALSNLIRFSRSRDPIMKYDSLSTLMSPADVSASLAGLEHCRDVPLFPIISGWQRSENRLKRLLSCVGMSKLLEWFLLFLATMASSHKVGPCPSPRKRRPGQSAPTFGRATRHQLVTQNYVVLAQRSCSLASPHPQ